MRRTILKLVLLLLSLMSCLHSFSASAQEVQWRTDYASARREAADKGRPLIIDFYTQACVYCRKLDVTTFVDPTVAATMNERFIPLKIDAEQERWLSQTLRIELFPTMVLAAPDGKIVDVLRGYMEAGPFLAYLQRTLANVSEPEWMARDYQDAAKAVQALNYGPAVYRLKKIIDDESAKDRPIQLKARQMLQDIESQAAARLTVARQFADKGQTAEAIEKVTVSGTGLQRHTGQYRRRQASHHPGQ